jgi:hypothetical protein
MQSGASLRAALIENIKLLNTNVVAMSDELRHWSQDNRRRAVEKWASHELQSPQSSLADPREAIESLTATERRSILKALVQTNGIRSRPLACSVLEGQRCTEGFKNTGAKITVDDKYR